MAFANHLQIYLFIFAKAINFIIFPYIHVYNLQFCQFFNVYIDKIYNYNYYSMYT